MTETQYVHYMTLELGWSTFWYIRPTFYLRSIYCITCHRRSVRGVKCEILCLYPVFQYKVHSSGVDKIYYFLNYVLSFGDIDSLR